MLFFVVISQIFFMTASVNGKLDTIEVVTLAENCILKRCGKHIIISFTGCICLDWKKANIPEKCFPQPNVINERNTVLLVGASYHLGFVMLEPDGHRYVVYYVPDTNRSGDLGNNSEYKIHGELAYFID